LTPNQLRTVLARLGLSQRAAARLLGIDERTMRKYVAGDLVIPELLVWALRGLAHREQDRDANSAACDGVMMTVDLDQRGSGDMRHRRVRRNPVDEFGEE
jgi:hypothetical protein